MVRHTLAGESAAPLEVFRGRATDLGLGSRSIDGSLHGSLDDLIDLPFLNGLLFLEPALTGFFNESDKNEHSHGSTDHK